MLIGKKHMIDNNGIKVWFLLQLITKEEFLKMKEQTPTYTICMLST